VGEGDGGRVTAAPPEERDVAGIGAHALRAADDGNLSLGECFLQAVAADLGDLGLGVDAVGHDPRLAAGVAGGVHADLLQRHHDECGRLALAGRDEHVHLPPRSGAADLGREPDELVGLLAHRTDHGDDVTAVAVGARHVVRHLADALGVGDRGAAELLHDEGHGGDKCTGGLVGRFPYCHADHYLLRPCPRTSESASAPAGRPAEPRLGRPRSAPPGAVRS
jgi:hypothetical protein